MPTSRLRNTPGVRRLPDCLAIGVACVFIFLAGYQIKLPGLFYDELYFVNAAQGAPDNTFIYMRLGSVPLFTMPYLGALKAWIYFPVFRFFGVSALSIRFPAILLAAVTLLIFYRAVRETVGAIWAAIAVWIMAVDPANIFPSRVDRGPTVLMHLFQAAILALWFSYRDKPKLWKPVLIFVCFLLGCFDKFNFLWLGSAFVAGVLVCYPDSLKNLWVSFPRWVPWVVLTLGLGALGTMLYIVSPLLHLLPAGTLVARLHANWSVLLKTLSGTEEAYLFFGGVGNGGAMIAFTSFWLIVTDYFLALACLFFPMSNAKARENRKNGFFCLMVGSLIFLQIIITPKLGGLQTSLAGGAHHYSMIFPLPLLTFAFLTRSLYSLAATQNLQRLAVLLFGFAAACLFVVNIHNTTLYLAHFNKNPHYNPYLSPEIYSLSRYINERGFEAKSIISADWGLHNQLHALAPKKLRSRMRDCWGEFKQHGEQNRKDQIATLNNIFPEGKSLVIILASVPDTEETERNLSALLAAHPELKSKSIKEFWLGGTKIYEVYEIVRPRSAVSQVRRAAATASMTAYPRRSGELRRCLDALRDET